MSDPTPTWYEIKYRKLRVKDLSSVSAGSVSAGSSRVKIEWLCDCGKTKMAAPFWVVNGYASSCGKCNVRDKDYWSCTKFGSLRMKTPIEINHGSSRVIEWLCDCGRIKLASTNKIYSGVIKSCGNCHNRSAGFWSETKFGNLKMLNPIEFSVKSTKKIEWLCDCGNITAVYTNRVISGVTKSCGKCNWLSQEYLSNTKFGSLRPVDPQSIGRCSDKKIEWECDCGRRFHTSMNHVYSGSTSTCGKCDWKSYEFWNSSWFGNLRMANPQEMALKSSKTTEWVCKCGQICRSVVSTVTSGHKSSCSKCYNSAMSWFNTNRDLIRSLRTPIHASEIPPGWIVINSSILKVHDKLDAICGACKSRYHPLWKDIRSGKSLTCGCVSYRMSRQHRDINDFLVSFGTKFENEKLIGHLKYDIFVSEHNIVLEFQGLRWHSFKKSKLRDLEKYRNALSLGYEYLCIFEDEWESKRDVIKDIIVNKLNLKKVMTLRPSKCEIKLINKDADVFYDRFHYIGGCKSKINYGVYYNGQLVACASFKRPTRQTSLYDFEIVRMCSHPDYRIHGIWNKLLNKFLSEYAPKSLVSFSDNRLFSGRVYQKMGFKYDGDIKSDYYWVKNTKRYHKSGLRKKGLERDSGKTEVQLREGQGYRKIWDLGKKRWVFHA